jgi:glycerol kinase
VILAIDQGTTGTTCLVVDAELRVLGRGHARLPQHLPQPGWVEHDPEEIWASALAAAELALADARVRASDLDGIGIANQRETTLLWDKVSGRPVARAIVWQDRRTAARCAELPAELLRERTGLVPDPYFSATKLEWLLAHTPEWDGLAFGTVDSWLVWKLTKGGVHATDATNASRTLLWSLARREWDDELLALFGVTRSLLPDVRPSSGVVAEGELFGATLPIAGIAGDQQASLFGHGCVAPGQAKATYGTGAFILAASGEDCSPPPHGLLRTAAVEGYALEGSILAAGSVLEWLVDLGLLGSTAESAELAASVPTSGGVHLVPALAGLGSPHWQVDARGTLTGVTRATGRAELVRAALEGIAFRVRDVLEELPPLEVLRVDGGLTANPFLMQFQADLLGIPVEVAAEQETTALGAAALAAQGLGLRDRPPDSPAGARYEPQLSRDEADARYADWLDALRRSLPA